MVALVACILLGGCGDEEDSSSPGAGGDAGGAGVGGSGGGEAAGAAGAGGKAGGSGAALLDCAGAASHACVTGVSYPFKQGDQGETAPWSCAPAPACPVVTFKTAGTLSSGPPYTLVDADSAACALAALRDRTPGALTFEVNPGGQLTRKLQIAILPNGKVLGSDREVMDLYATLTFVGPVDPKAAAYFTACLAETDGTKVHDCLFGYTAGCTPP